MILSKQITKHTLCNLVFKPSGTTPSRKHQIEVAIIYSVALN